MVSSEPLAAPIRPAECAAVRQNPPDFGWPDASPDAAYQITLVYPDGRVRTLAAAQNWINWDEVLPPGAYLWQIELTDSNGTRISRAREFSIGADASPFLVPDAAALLTRVTAASHPRGLPDSTSLALMLAERRSAVSMLETTVTSQLAAALPAAPMSSGEAQVHDESRRTLNALTAYLYTKQDLYFSDARRRLLNLAAWDARGSTSYAAAARSSREIAWTLALGYDWLHPRLETAEKDLVLAAIQARGADMYNDVIGPRARIAKYPRDAEGNQTLVVLAVLSTLVAGDLSEADTWLQGALPLAINATSPWSTEEGGFANGDAFGTRDVGELLVPWYVLRWSAAIDLAQKAWVRNWSRFLAYFLPAGSPSGVFGDGAERSLGEARARFAKGYTQFAPSALGRWHASQLTGEDTTQIEYLLAPLAGLAPNALPEATPSSAVFPSLGQAALHSSLADPARTSIYFKSSPAPYGAFDHSHADQNSFVINAGGERLAIGSGYYDGDNTPHWRQWYKQTRAHNAITFDGGKGQLFFEQDGKIGYGAITNYGLNQDQDIVHGDATQAYGGALREAKRSIVYLRPNLVLVYDRLGSDNPRRWEWNIHALNPMTVISDRQISIERNGQRLCVDMLAGPNMRFTQTDRFTTEPTGSFVPQWHGTFTSVNRLSATDFIALLNVGCTPAAASASKTGGLWTVLAGNNTVTISDIGISVGPSASSPPILPTEITPPPTLDTQAPSVPGGLVATAVSTTQIDLSWNASTDNVGVAGYYVYLNNVALATTTATSFTHTGLSAGTTYNYRVSAFDAVPNHSAWTASVAVTTPPPPDTQAPSVPAGLVATAVSSTQINLTWNASTDNVGVAGYTVYLNDAVLAKTAGTFFSHTGLTAGTTYSYRVSAYDAVPNGSAWTLPVAATTTPLPDTQAPSVPTGLVGTAVSSAQIDLTWNASTDNVGVAGYTVYLNNAVLARTAGTAFSHAGRAPCTTYNYRVSAYDAVPNHSAWTASIAVTTPGTDCQAPSVPTGLVATAVSSTQINLSWNASSDNIGVVGYTVYLNNAVLAHTAETTFSHTGLAAGTTYNYRVSAYDAIPNHSAWTAPVAVTTPPPPDTIAPSTPAGLIASALTSTSLTLSWSAATDNVAVTGYRVYRDGVLVASPAGTTVSISGLSASTSYAFTVAALDAAGNASAQSPALSVTTWPVPDITPPSIPTGLAATVNSPVNLSWTASTDDVGVAGYRVYRDGVLVASPAGTSVSITGLSASTLYIFTVAAFDGAGNASAQSAPLSVTTPPAPDTTAPSTPTGLTATAITATSLMLSWSAATDNVGVTGYRVYRDGTLAASPSGTSVSITALAASTRYAFTIAALDAAGNASPQSAALSVTTSVPPAPPGPTPYSGTPIAIPGTFEAENFDRGGEGVAYHDNVIGNVGGQYRPGEDVDIIVSADSLGGGYVVNNFETGEWLAYTINVAASASYDIEIRVSSLYPSSAFHVEIDGVNATGSVPVPNTGNWNTFQWVGKKAVSLSAGQHVLKLVADQQYFNLNSIRVLATPSSPPPPPPADPGTVTFFCTFANAPTDCGFGVQQKVAGRASIVNIGRDGSTGVRLHTEPGDSAVAGSGSNERNDLTLSVEETEGYQGREQWWAHSILFPSDFVSPPSGWGVVMDFHNASPGGGQAGGQANFHVDSSRWDGDTLHFRGYGGVLASSSDAPGEYQVTLGPIVRNVWYDFVYHVKWSSGSDGFFHAWVNGVKKLSYNGPTLYRYNGVDQEVYLKLANYHSAFGQASSVIHDRVIRGTSALAVSAGPLEGVLGLVNGVLTPLP